MINIENNFINYMVAFFITFGILVSASSFMFGIVSYIYEIFQDAPLLEAFQTASVVFTGTFFIGFFIVVTSYVIIKIMNYIIWILSYLKSKI